MTGEPEADLRGGGSDGDAVPADAALTHLMAMAAPTAAVAAREGVGDLTGNIPREGGQQYQPHHRGGNNHHKAAAEAAAGDQPVGFDAGDERHVDRREVAHHLVRYSHNRESGTITK